MTRLSLRLYVILLFVVAVLLVTALSTAFGISQASHGIRASMIERQKEAGNGAAVDISYVLDSARLALGSTAALVTASDLRDPVDHVIGPILDPLLVSRVFSAAALLDSEARIVVARPPGPYHANLTFAQDPAFGAAFQTRQAVVHLPSAPGEPYWIMRIPATYGTSKPYFVAGILSVPLIEGVLFTNVDPQSHAVLLNPSGFVIAATEPQLRADAFVQWAPLRRIRDGLSTIEEAKSPVDSDDVILTASGLPQYEALVALLSPKTQIESLQGQLIQGALVSSLGLAATAIVLGVVAANTITRPLEDVRQATRRMSDGDLSVRARPRGARELQDLATDFNSMAANLAKEWEQRVQLQNHLEELVAQRTKELDVKREEMELFFYSVSHDFKSPVISISNLTQLLAEAVGTKELDRKEIEQLAARVRRSALNLEGLVLELLEFAQAGRSPPNMTNVRLGDVARAVVDEASAAATHRKVRLEASGPRIEASIDPARLRHILTNLVQNAIKYMPNRRHPRVQVTWERRAGQVRMHVEDNGAGIPPAIQANLFRPFLRHVPAGGTTTSGAGLGLSIVKRLTESMGGKVTMETAVGRGTRFTISFPVEGPKRAAGKRATGSTV